MKRLCHSADEALEYVVGEDCLRDVITQVTVLDRTILVAGSSKSVKYRETPIQNACYAATCYEVYAHQQNNETIRKINEWIWSRNVK